MNKKILIIGLIWPEPNATAAGTRMIQLVRYFLQMGYEIHFASTATMNELSYDLKSLHVSCLSIKLNCSSFDEQIQELAPDIVLFDRFLSEEQFGWRIQDSCPQALRILDTEDLHFLRRSRELAHANKSDNWKQFLHNDIAKREIASMYRCDFSLLISEFEMNLLLEDFKIPPYLLFYLPFIDEAYAQVDYKSYPDFSKRKHFMTLGNFKHKPNADSVRFLRSHIWPNIRKKMPDCELHVYGAYVTEGIKQLESKDLGFYIKGWISNKQEAYVNYKVCLAPLNFGAGQKGKLLDAMYFGTPSVTTGFGAEGMSSAERWNGFVTDEREDFIEKAILLYCNKESWLQAQSKGAHILSSNYNSSVYEKKLTEKIQHLTEDLTSYRKQNFIGAMLMHHNLQSTKYLSKWIELKNYRTIK